MAGSSGEGGPPRSEGTHLAAVSRYMEERIPLHAWLGLRVLAIEPDYARVLLLSLIHI